jgi:hypothetical protein
VDKWLEALVLKLGLVAMHAVIGRTSAVMTVPPAAGERYGRPSGGASRGLEISTLFGLIRQAGCTFHTWV